MADEDRLLSEDHSEIRLVPAAVRDIWQQTRPGGGQSRELRAWRKFLATDEGKAWLRERAKAHALQRKGQGDG